MTTKVGEGNKPVESTATTGEIMSPPSKPVKAREIGGFEMAPPPSGLATNSAGRIGAPPLGIPVAAASKRQIQSQSELQKFLEPIAKQVFEQLRKENPSFGGRLEITIEKDNTNSQFLVKEILFGNTFTGSSEEKQKFTQTLTTRLNIELRKIQAGNGFTDTNLRWPLSLG